MSDSTGGGSPGRRSVVEHARRDQERRDDWTRRGEIREVIDLCGRALARGTAEHYLYVAEQLRDRLLPLLLPDDGQESLAEYDRVLADHQGWDWVALTDFADSPSAWVRRLQQPQDQPAHLLQAVRGDGATPDGKARLVVEKAYRSLVAIAEHEDIVKDDYSGRVDVVGFTSKIGEQLQDAEMDIGNPVQAISRQSGAVKTLFCGGTGQGKSATLELEAIDDLYQLNFEDGRDMKVIDLIGTGDGENWFYDIPQQDASLRRVRREQGLAETFADDRDRGQPQLEILLPLTPGLTESNLPYDAEVGRFTVRPFTVPACEIRKPLMVSMITAKLTDSQESIIRDAYDEVDNSRDDWALVDLAREIWERDELKAEKKKPVVRTLRQLQNQGFIRTRSSEHTLDWRGIFEDTETITVFSQAFVESTIAQLISIGYVIHTIAEERTRMPDLPKCALLMRELWTVAPHNRRREFDQRAAQLQEAIGHMLAKIFRVNRRRGVHILADTQQPSDLLKSVREMFNRYVVFDTNKRTVKDIFEWTANDKWRSFYNTLTPRAGEASVVGMVEPAVTERHIEFVGPIEYAAPSHHHFDEDTDFTGWHSRVQYLDREELRRPADVDGVDWPDRVPSRLVIDFGTAADDAPDVVSQPVAVFAERYLRVEDGVAVKKRRVKAAFNQFIYEHPDREDDIWDFSENAVNQRFGKALRAAVDCEADTTTRDNERAFKNLRLSREGERLADADLDGLDDAAEPIRTG